MERTSCRGWCRRAMAAAMLVWAAMAPASAQTVPITETMPLSGSGPDDATRWDFRIDGGRRAGGRTTIPVPSNWQQQGFGHYQYGYDRAHRHAGRALYRRSFTPPAAWRGRAIRIVFDGVMTDALVRINGSQAGAVHQGGFNRFSYDISRLVKPGEPNVVEVEVAEASAATDTDKAERHGDFWVFGGIYRPVWLEAAPAQSVAHVAIDAKADGALTADVELGAPRTVTRVAGQVVDRAGRAVSRLFDAPVAGGGSARVRLAGRVPDVAPWSAEAPNLYYLDVTLFEGDVPVHRVRERFGFRTFELREGQGLFLNGKRILLKGVNRHSFRPDTGRAISRADAYADARTIRSLNMNAVRSHYAPEKAFIEAADELGLYLIMELSGWQHAHDTEVGRKLVRSLVERDVNHPSVLIWANGNEGGWNLELDGDFHLYDPQKRPVIHPWDAYGGIDTKHYPRYPDLLRRLDGRLLVLPTEVLHGLYDGGHGAGLDDYWRAISTSPRGIGTFLWNFADEGIARTDQGGRIDLFGTFAPDGLVDARGRPEPSFHTVRDIWSPVQIQTPQIDAAFDGTLRLANRYDFTALSGVAFRWEWLRFPGPAERGTAARVIAAGTVAGPAIAPGEEGVLRLPAARPATADALRVSANRGAERLSEWVWPVDPIGATNLSRRRAGAPAVTQDAAGTILSAGAKSASFDRVTGLLTGLRNGSQAVAVIGGPQLVVSRPAGKGEPAWRDASPGPDGIYRLGEPMLANLVNVDLGLAEADGWAGFLLEVSADMRSWKTIYNGARVARDGNLYPFSAQRVQAVRVTRLSGVRAAPTVVSVRVAGQPERYRPPALDTPVRIVSGTGRDPATGRTFAWLEAPAAGGLTSARWTLRDDGTLTLDYAYRLEGPVLYHGIGFARPGTARDDVRALVRGPWPVWQNRLRGPVLGVHDIAAPVGRGLPTPGTAGYFADPHWVRFAGPDGKPALTIASQGARFLQLGARLTDTPTTTVEFPATDFGFMQAIPAMGAKGHAAELTGPAGEPALAQGTYAGTLVLAF